MKKEVKILIILLILVPLGLLAGEAWGEWEPSRFKELVGYIPQGMQKLYGLWKAPFPDYSFSGLPSLPSYILSSLIGAGIVILIFYIMKRFKRG